MEDDKAKEEPTREVALIKSSSKPLLTDHILEIHVPQREGKVIATDDQPDVQTKLVPASKEGVLILMLQYLTEVIKVIQEEAEKIELDPKIIISAKEGEKFKKA
ncbi:hypothetical protein Tco_0379696 [Tanacetum coccineum]